MSAKGKVAAEVTSFAARLMRNLQVNVTNALAFSLKPLGFQPQIFICRKPRLCRGAKASRLASPPGLRVARSPSARRYLLLGAVSASAARDDGGWLRVA